MTNTIPSPDPNNLNDDILPAFYAPTSISIFPTGVTNKIDLSSSVSQFLKKDSSQKTDSYVAQGDSGFTTEPLDGKTF